MRKADTPGTYRIRSRNGEFKLSGVKRDGRRVNLSFSAEGEAKDAARALFPAHYAPKPSPVSTIDDEDWGIPSGIPGLPSVGRDTAGAVAAAMGIGPLQPPAPGSAPSSEPVVEEDPDKSKKREADLARSKSLCEFFGVAWAMGDAWASRALTKKLGKDPVKITSKQVTDLGKAATTSFETLLGDWELGPWTMLFLLTLAMPIGMIIQSPKLELAKVPDKEPTRPVQTRTAPSGPSSSESSDQSLEYGKLRSVDIPDPSKAS